MRLTEIALAITLVLLAITAYLAFEGHRDQPTPEDGVAGSDGRSVNQRLSAIERQMSAIRRGQDERDPVRSSASGESEAEGETSGSDALAGMIDREREEAGASGTGATPNPPREPQLTELERKVLRAPSIATVQVYDADYNVMQISAGSEIGLREGVELSVRRDQFLLGTLRITAVEEGASAGEMILDTMPAGLVVEAGDEVIQKIVGGS